MRANSPSSIVVSLTLHVFFAAIVFVTTIYIAHEPEPPVVFELVAGPPTAPGELVAPALGNTPHPVKLNVAKVELPPDKPDPPVSEQPKPREPEVPDAVPAKPESVKPLPAAKPKVDMSIVTQMRQKQKTSYKDYLKKHPTPKPPANPPVQRTGKVPRVDAQGIANGVIGGSTANTHGGGGGKALTREEQSEFNTYISFLLNALKEAHEPPPGVSDLLKAQVTFDITASGAILNPRISKSSGNHEFDESVLEAFRRVKSIGPTPNGKSDTWTVTFRMKDVE